MFNIDRSGSERIHFDGLSFEVETNPKQFVNFDLFFNLVQTDERMIVECEYNTDLHDASTIRHWLRCFEQLIESAISDGGTPLSSLAMLDSADRKLLLETWNDTRRDYPRTATLPALISEVAAMTPEKTVVSCGYQKITCQELERQSTALAARLQAAGVCRGDLVGIHLERSVRMVTGLLAILKCGAAYVPMDPSFPAERLGFMVDDAHMKVILSQREIRASLPASAATVLGIDDSADPLATNFTPVEIDPEDIAYVIFTSGSTGRPKGVRIPHRAVVNFLNSMRREPGLKPEDVLLSVTTLSFDIAGLEIFLPLTTGAETVIATREITLDGNRLATTIKDAGITVLQATPATWRLLLEAGWSGKKDLKILVGGEAVPRDLVNRLAPLCAEIWNVYGPTETTIWSTAARLAPGDGPVSIGKPIDNTQVFIVNTALQPQPIGIAGELLIGGDGLASGYHERPDLTDDRFITAPPALGIRDVKVYRTGDLARWNPDGTLECLGRMDHQVKIRGFRIELGDIESHLEKHPAVSQAVTAVHDGRLVAYLKTSTSGDGTTLWRDQWDMLYQSAIDQSGGGQLDRLDAVIAGWSGIEGIDEQVSEWIDTTVDRIRGYRPGRIFEIGCGTGQLLARLSPSAESYWAADISKVAIEALEKNNSLPQVRLFHRPADDFSGMPAAGFDTVIINSVAQYFPNADYLARVLTGAAALVKPGGRIFLGDIQSHALLAAHHAEALRERAPLGATSGSLREKLAQRLAAETELSLDPAWFESFRRDHPEISHIETPLRRGRISNETNTYHYDVILHVGSKPALRELPDEVQWRNLNLEQLEAMLSASPAQLFVVRIPDARLAKPIGFLQSLRNAPSDAAIPVIPSVPANAATVEDIHHLGESSGYRVEVRWQGDGSTGQLEAVFFPKSEIALPAWPPQNVTAPAASYANRPAANSPQTDDITATLRRHLAASLPDYMIPSAFVTLDAFPLTPNGKVDRKALPAPSAATMAPAAARTLTAPRNDAERALLEIWKQVLGNDGIGVEDDIFELGGDSILIFQISTRANRAGIPLTPARMFRLRTIAALVAEPAEAVVKSAVSTIQRVNRDAYRRNL
jgi:amino acid adenylation domain-containing protein